MQHLISRILQVATNPLIFVFIAALLRLLPHPPNVAPIAALALFGGAYLGKRYALAVPFCAMLTSDMFLGFHATMPYVYGSFFATGIVGLWLARHKTVRNTIAATLGSSLLFFLVTNFGVWAQDALYPKTFDGLILSYAMGLPFFRNTLVGDFFFVGILFGGYELARFGARYARMRLGTQKI